MEVEATPSVAELRRESAQLAAYLQGCSLVHDAKVLVSRRFYYFGNTAIPLHGDLQRVLIRQQGCKKLTDDEITRLSAYLARKFS